MHRLTLIHRAALFALAAAPTAFADDWTPSGGPPGGIVTAIAAANGDSYVGTRGGVFRSSDAGQTWTHASANFGGLTTVVALAATESGGVLVSTIEAGLRRSTDGGDTWSPASVPVFGGLFQEFQRNGERIYGLITVGQSAASLWFTDDVGASWFAVGTGAFAPLSIFADGQLLLAGGVEPLDPNTGFGLPTIFRSTDGGESWSESAGVPLSFFGFFDFTRADEALFVSAEGDSILRSDDDGQSWVRCGYPANSALQNQHLTAIGGDVYFSAFRRDDATPQVGPGVWKSSDSGNTWTRQNTGLPNSINLAADMIASDDRLLMGGLFGLFGKDGSATTWLRSETGLASSFVFAMSGNETALFASPSATSQVFRLQDDVWQLLPVNFPSNAQVLGVAAFDDGLILAGTQVHGIRRSTDDGNTWQAANTGVPRYNGTAGLQFREIESFARNSSFVFAGTEIGLQQVPGSQGFFFTGGGMIRSSNVGASWQAINTGFPTAGFDNFGNPVFEPVRSLFASDTVVLAGTWRQGMFRSTNNGASWSAANQGIPTAGDTLLASIESIVTLDGVIFAALGQSEGVVRSTDNGQTWSDAASFDLPLRDVESLVPFVGDLYASTGGSGSSADDGVFRFDPEAFTWIRVGDALTGVGVKHLAVTGGELYAGSRGLGTWRLAAPCPGDVNGDGSVELFDLAIVLTNFGTPSGATLADGDFDSDADVDLLDLATLLTNFGGSCE